MIKKSTLILIIILLFIFNKTLSANEKQKITENFNSIDTLKFDFNQISHDKQESGKCFLKRPHFLKCIYEDKNQKQLIINKNTLIVHQARYNKSYFYPTKRSYFLDILDSRNLLDKLCAQRINSAALRKRFLVGIYLIAASSWYSGAPLSIFPHSMYAMD